MSNPRIRERLAEGLSTDMVNLVTGPDYRFNLENNFDYYIQIGMAHVIMLAKQAIISPEEAASLLQALKQLADQGLEDSKCLGWEDLYSLLEQKVIAQVGVSVGGKMHTGRSRNDMANAVARMLLRDKTLQVLEALTSLREVLLKMAEQYSDYVMPGVTHWQHAQPITFGYYVLALGEVMERDAHRLIGALARTNLSPLGAAALAGTSWPLDRPMVAEMLGFAQPIANAYDAIASCDYLLELTASLVNLATNLCRVCEDVCIWTTMEFNYAEIADRYSSVSSIMPQKKNPGSMESLKTVAGDVIGHWVEVMANIKNTPFNRAGDALASYKGVAEAAEETKIIVEILTGVLDSMQLRKEIMERKADEGYSTMTELADTIVREKNLSFRMAHNIVAQTVRYALEERRTAIEIDPALLDRSTQELFGHPLHLSEEALRKALSAAENIKMRKIIGGPAPEECARMRQRQCEEVKKTADEVRRVREAVAVSRKSLEDQAADFIGKE